MNSTKEMARRRAGRNRGAKLRRIAAGRGAAAEAQSVSSDPRAHTGLVKKIALELHLRVGGRIELEDLEQEVVLHVLANRHTFDPRKGAFSTWLMACRRTIADRTRRRLLCERRGDDGYRGLRVTGRIDRGFALEAAGEEGGRPDCFHPPARPEPPPSDERTAAVWVAMAKLKSAQAEVLRLRTMGGFTLDDVGSMLGVSRERVRKLERDGLAELKRMLGGDGVAVSIAQVSSRSVRARRGGRIGGGA